MFLYVYLLFLNFIVAEFIARRCKLCGRYPHSLERISTKMAEGLLKGHGRTLCATQAQLLREAVKACPNPLFVKLACHDACIWRSYDTSANTTLQKDTSSQMNMVFDRLRTEVW